MAETTTRYFAIVIYPSFVTPGELCLDGKKYKYTPYVMLHEDPNAGEDEVLQGHFDEWLKRQDDQNGFDGDSEYLEDFLTYLEQFGYLPTGMWRTGMWVAPMGTDTNQ